MKYKETQIEYENTGELQKYRQNTKNTDEIQRNTDRKYIFVEMYYRKKVDEKNCWENSFVEAQLFKKSNLPISRNSEKGTFHHIPHLHRSARRQHHHAWQTRGVIYEHSSQLFKYGTTIQILPIGHGLKGDGLIFLYRSLGHEQCSQHGNCIINR